jgi:hypothetical protein
MTSLNESYNLDPSAIVSGHNGEKQLLTVKRSLIIQHPTGRTQMVERICEDQWLNTYLVFSCKLSDHEVYEVADYVKPSVITHYKGFTDALLDDYRAKAFAAFASTERELNAIRSRADLLASSLIASNVAGAN